MTMRWKTEGQGDPIEETMRVRKVLLERAATKVFDSAQATAIVVIGLYADPDLQLNLMVTHVGEPIESFATLFEELRDAHEFIETGPTDEDNVQ
jgi:hypothetical protein